jgi:chorismate dehydratase
MLRVGAVAYLNTTPLVEHLPELAPDLDLVLAVPSQLAEDLAAGMLDIGLIPVIEYFRAGNYTILPGSCIASRGPVMSVRLCSRVPFAAIKSVAWDAGSRTSVALATLLLRRAGARDYRGTELPLAADPRAVAADAVLAIGDRAMQLPDGAFPFEMDLGAEWTTWTGLPFVWAVWAVAPGVAVPAATRRAFHDAKQRGRREIPALAAREALRLGLDPARCRHYLEHAIRHDLGDDELAGLRRFGEMAAAAGLAPQEVDLVFHGQRDPVESR